MLTVSTRLGNVWIVLSVREKDGVPVLADNAHLSVVAV